MSKSLKWDRKCLDINSEAMSHLKIRDLELIKKFMGEYSEKFQYVSLSSYN